MLHFVEQRDEVAKVAAEAVKGNYGDDVELPPLRLGHQCVETGTALPRARHGMVDELSGDGPAGTFGMFTERPKLVLHGLIVRAHAGVQCRPQVGLYHSSSFLGWKQKRAPERVRGPLVG